MISESVEVKQLKFYVTPKFVQEFLDLFDSEESVERDYLKNILHKLYAKVIKEIAVIFRDWNSPCWLKCHFALMAPKQPQKTWTSF